MEEDIKFIKYYINEYIAVEDIGIEDDFKFQEVIEQLIKAYKELKGIEESHRKENGELRERVKELEGELEKINKQLDLDYVDNNYIPVSLVEEKIEELKENGYWNYLEKRDLETTIYILQELLEGRK